VALHAAANELTGTRPLRRLFAEFEEAKVETVALAVTVAAIAGGIVWSMLNSREHSSSE
jgi:hypothetical protein